MPFLNEQDREQVRQHFEALVNPVKLVMFTQALECQFCEETRQLVEEVASLSDDIEAEIHNFAIDKEAAKTYDIDKIPAIAIVGTKDYGVRYYGIPSGYEFTSLIEDITLVSQGDSGLSEATRARVAEINRPVHIQVFVTPT